MRLTGGPRWCAVAPQGFVEVMAPVFLLHLHVGCTGERLSAKAIVVAVLYEEKQLLEGPWLTGTALVWCPEVPVHSLPLHLWLWHLVAVVSSQAEPPRLTLEPALKTGHRHAGAAPSSWLYLLRPVSVIRQCQDGSFPVPAPFWLKAQGLSSTFLVATTHSSLFNYSKPTAMTSSAVPYSSVPQGLCTCYTLCLFGTHFLQPVSDCCLLTEASQALIRVRALLPRSLSPKVGEPCQGSGLHLELTL